MAINIKVTTPGVNNIRFSTNASPIVIESGKGGTGGSNELKTLNDVVLADQSNGDLLFYRSSDKTFVLQSANNINITNVDGGSF
jgi:alpha-D-ribose 1-methylphosphonate 5-triphosphate synthase subunit PhnL